MADNQKELQEFEHEYKHIRRDVRKVVIINLLIIALLIGMYFLNQQTGTLDQLLNRF